MKNVIAIIKDTERLRERCDEINAADVFQNKTVRSITKDLRETITKYKGLVALSAPQLGYHYRIFCMRFEDGEIRTFVNPLIMTREKESLKLSREHQIGISDEIYLMPRSSEISAVFQTPMGSNQACEFKEHVAFIFQQMCDLLDGVLISDIGLKIDEDFDKASKEEQQEIINFYLEHIKQVGDEVRETIKNDPVQNAVDETINQLTKINLGTAEFTKIDDEVKEQIKKEFEDKKKESEDGKGNN